MQVVDKSSNSISLDLSQLYNQCLDYNTETNTVTTGDQNLDFSSKSSGDIHHHKPSEEEDFIDDSLETSLNNLVAETFEIPSGDQQKAPAVDKRF